MTKETGKTQSRFLALLLAGILGCGTAVAPPIAAAQDAPLLMPGKTQIFQRVLIRNESLGRETPGDDTGTALAPLTALFVYERADDWLRVGFRENGQDMFWVPTLDTLDWNQNIVATFEASENLDRLMFFNEIDTLYDLIDMEQPGLAARPYREEAEAAERGEGPSEYVAALGPRRVIDQRRNLYVMPILDYTEEVFENGAFVNLLRVAVARARPLSEGGSVPLPVTREIDDYRMGVVFVVDTTITMDPYIRATAEAIDTVFEQIEAAGLSDTVSFGLVGYRDNTSGVPGLEYDTRTYVTLQDGADRASFAQAIGTMQEARVSTRHWREDAYAGVLHALEQMEWGDFDARFIILVTDASPREADDDWSLTGLSGRSLNTLVREQINGAIAVMHLRSQLGAADHDRAEASYRELSRFPNQPSFYYPIEGASRALFLSAARDVGAMLVGQVREFRESPDSVLSLDGQSVLEIDENRDQFAGLASAGRAMQLAFLGRVEGEQAPDVFEAFVADRDFDRPGLRPLSIRVLISKAQLSALYDALNIIIEQGEENMIDPAQFFTQVLGAAADMSRNPDQVIRRADTTLAEATAINEYIEDLPYRSRIMTITEEDWLDMSFSEQAALINELYDKVGRYRRYNDATDLWVDFLGTGAVAQNLLFPLPLDDLP
jgi:serine/threonine-protein kinase PpkA